LFLQNRSIKKLFTPKTKVMKQKKITAAFLLLIMLVQTVVPAFASSHREAPLISNDPLADNTDLYAFRSPDNPNKVTIIANYIPGQLPQGGPNYYSFGQNVRYEVHIDNDVSTTGDDIIYRFRFFKAIEDSSTFFNIRLGKQNLKTTYKVERSVNGGRTFQTIISNGVVPPPNIGPRSISSPVGLNAPDYNSLIKSSIKTACTGEKVFCGTSDDPFFVDLGGIFDLGDAPRASGKSVDGLKCLNVSTIALQVDISTLQKNNKPVAQCTSILDPNYVIGVWASASRQQFTVLKDDGSQYSTGRWIQVSRLGMPLTNEAVVPIGFKDLWNSMTPYQDLSKLSTFGKFFYNPELALYMDDALFGPAVPSFNKLRIQKNSLGAFGFGNGQNGLFGLKGNAALNGTALSEAAFGGLLLPAANSPRSVDLWPIFHTGVPNLRPYQLATGKAGNPLAAGKPFISNFLPNGGDMLRLNMAVPPTPRNSSAFSPLGLVAAAVSGLTDPAYNNTSIQSIPNMDGFPNGRRLEDDVTRIELQAVSGVVLAAIGLWYDDFVPGTSPSPVTPNLVNVLTYSTGVDANDKPFKTQFPYVATPFAGTDICPCDVNTARRGNAGFRTTFNDGKGLAVSAPTLVATASPNPFTANGTVKYHLAAPAMVDISLLTADGKKVKQLVNSRMQAGNYTQNWNGSELTPGVYVLQIVTDGEVKETIKLVKGK
jgi:hypothetical protein